MMDTLGLDIVVFDVETKDGQRVKDIYSILDFSKADLLLFPGHTLYHGRYLNKVRPPKRATQSVMEVKDIGAMKTRNWLFTTTSNGKLEPMNTHQLFTSAKEIQNNPILGEVFLDVFSRDRVFELGNKTVRVLQCGENNILKNRQGQGNRVVPRFSDANFKNRLVEILDKTDILLHPIHTPMGNQGKMVKRAEYLSKGRIYASTCNNDWEFGAGKDLRDYKLHSVYQNGRALPSPKPSFGNPKRFLVYSYHLQLK